jgi:hypothetical protein
MKHPRRSYQHRQARWTCLRATLSAWGSLVELYLNALRAVGYDGSVSVMSQ